MRFQILETEEHPMTLSEKFVLCNLPSITQEIVYGTKVKSNSPITALSLFALHIPTSSPEQIYFVF